MIEFLFNRNPLLILSYLSLNKYQDMIYGAKVARELGISQGGTSEILRKLETAGIIKSDKAGRAVFYRVNREHPILISFRVFENMATLEPLIERIQIGCRRIILFGSCANGTDDIDSDIDLFIVTDDPGAIRQTISEFVSEREIRPVIMDPIELSRMEQTDPVFIQEVYKGKVIWEASHD